MAVVIQFDLQVGKHYHLTNYNRRHHLGFVSEYQFERIFLSFMGVTSEKHH